jgi:excisionase family DNA binding protein
MGIQHSANSPAVLTISETAIYFRISRASVWRLLRTGRLKKTRIGGRTLVRRTDADAFLETCSEAA